MLEEVSNITSQPITNSVGEPYYGILIVEAQKLFLVDLVH